MNAKERELADLVVRYAAANDEKKAISAEVKDLGDEIKEIMGESEITQFAISGYVAKLGGRVTKTIDVAAVEKLIGYKLPATCYKYTECAVLTVAAEKVKAQVA